VIELAFHKDVYAGEAVDAAVQTFARFAALEAVEGPSHWLVRVTGKTPARERSVAGELANHALGATAARRGARR
jgi:hypothetical protein